MSPPSPMRGGAVLLLAAAVQACGSSPAAPGAPAPAGAQLTVRGEPVLTMTRGPSATLAVEERDGQGRPVQNGAGGYIWETSDPAVVRVSSAGVLSTGHRARICPRHRPVV